MPRNVAKGLTYADAVELLEGKDSKVLGALGKFGLAPLADMASGATAGLVDFGAVADGIVGYGQSVAHGVRERLSGASRLDRTQRIAAAHTVIVLAAFYGSVTEALAGAGFSEADYAMPAAEQVAVAGGVAPQLVSVAKQNLDGLTVPLPSPELPFEAVKQQLAGLHGRFTANVKTFLHGLAIGGRDPRRVDRALAAATLDDFLRRYEISYRALMVEVPEFAVWTQLSDGQATRSQVTSRLDGLITLLQEQSDGDRIAARRADLATVYAGLLTAPVLGSADSLDNVTVPTLEQGYVNPAGRVRSAGRTDLPSTESWWEKARMLDDVQPFLAGYLSSPQAVATPLVVLGQPGSGKSVLTKVLAARLPEVGFFTVRVTLRNVNADSSIRQQIEDTVYAAIGRHAEWADLAADAGPTLPVVMLDGFDELLQAAGTNKADYLEQVVEFQRTEASLGRPLAVIVTSRVVVADRARFPDGTAVLLLDPFERPQVEQWLTSWYDVNPGLPRLTADEVIAQGGELSGQPLLLMMLALYHAGGNSLAEQGEHRAALYEKLLTDFAIREIRKHSPGLSPEDEIRAVQDELHRLSLVAVGIFVRRAQTITEAEIDADLAVLLPAPAGGGKLTASQVVAGRFFFVHESSATEHTGQTSHTYEFLHATFGEFLIARYIHRALTQLTEDRRYFASRANSGQMDGGPIWAVLSFAAIAGRQAVADFYQGLATLLLAEEREERLTTVLDLLSGALYFHPTWTFHAYEPVQIPVTARYAAYSANLTHLSVLTALDALETQKDWPSMAALWKSQLTEDEWNGLSLGIRLSWSPNLANDKLGWRSMIEAEKGTALSIASIDNRSNLPGRWGDYLYKELGAETGSGVILRRNAFGSDREALALLWATAPYLSVAGDLAGNNWYYILQVLLELTFSTDTPSFQSREESYLLLIQCDPETRRIALTLLSDRRRESPDLVLTVAAHALQEGHISEEAAIELATSALDQGHPELPWEAISYLNETLEENGPTSPKWNALINRLDASRTNAAT